MSESPLQTTVDRERERDSKREGENTRDMGRYAPSFRVFVKICNVTLGRCKEVRR